MTNDNVRHLKGNASMQDDLIDLINYTFGFNGAGSDFYKLLPKLYKREYNPCASEYVTYEGDRIKAAVGGFDMNLCVSGEKLLCRGIGNVAVHPFSRSKGYMKTLMELSLEDMINSNVDFSVLGGRRQRYNYFSFEKGGMSYSFSINSDNIRHTFGKDRQNRFEIRKIMPDDKAVLAEISLLVNSRPYHVERDINALYDILVSWQAVPYAAYDNGKFAGYAVVRKETVTECDLIDTSLFAELAAALYDKLSCSTLSFTVPPFRRDLLFALQRFAEGCSIGFNEMYSILNYEKVCSAFFKLKSEYEKLPDGEFTLCINGRAKKETLLFKVSDGKASVTAVNREPQLVLDQLEAETLLFGITPLEFELPAYVKAWLPLPIWMYSADMV